MRRSVHLPAVAAGALVALAIAVPTAILAQTLDETGTVDDDSTWLIVLFAVVVLGMVAGGHVAATRRPDAPLVNSGLAALAAYLVVQIIAAVRLLVGDEPVSWVAIPIFALLCTAAGMTGGLVADHRARNPRR